MIYILSSYAVFNPPSVIFLELCPRFNLNSSGCKANTSATFPGTVVGFFAENIVTMKLIATLSCLEEGHWSSLLPDCNGM